MLERMRDSVKDRMKPKLAKDSFIVPPYEIARSSADGIYRLGQAAPIKSPAESYYDEEVKRLGLTCNHFVSLRSQYAFSGALERPIN